MAVTHEITAVTSMPWWQVWWPWMLVWGVTLLTTVTAVVLLVRRLTTREPVKPPRVAFYLGTTAIMDMYQLLRYKPALQSEVQEEIKRSSNSTLKKAFPGVLDVGGGVQVDRNVFKTYIENDEPITVISILMDVLNTIGDISQIDLPTRTIIPGKLVAAEVTSSRRTAAPKPGSLRLSELDCSVLLQGEYRQAPGATENMVTFHAPYGTADSPVRVRIDCEKSDLRRQHLPDGPFKARCLGRVERWDGRQGELVVAPIAIFK